MKYVIKILLALAAITVIAIFAQLRASQIGSKPMSAEKKQNKSTHKKTEPIDPNKCQKATFAAGCFWHVQYEFDKTPGVASTTVGYTGGEIQKPTYKQVCSGKTGHAEAVEMLYDPNKLSYEKLLEIFFENHNPTTKNRQGFDIGTQYRSAIFYHNPDQQKAALAKIDELSKSGKFKKPIVTEIKPAKSFYKAEEYHQKYYEKGGLKSCLGL